MRRLALVALAVGAVVLALGSSAQATTNSSTSVPFQARIGHILGLLPPMDTTNGQIANQAPASGSLYYNGGPVMTTSTVYTIYWQPSGYQFPSGYIANINQYFKDLQATAGQNTNVYDVGTQYYQ